MNDPVISRFAQACGASGPLDLRVDLVDGGILAEGTVAQPFSLVGADDACDVTLTDAEVNPRHAWLQVVGGRAFAVDLGSRTGLWWPGGATGSGWLDVGTPVRFGPFQLRLRSPISSKPTPFPTGYNPLQSDPGTARSRPAVSLEFRNGKRAKDRWAVNRLVTIVGRAPECKIHLSADDIANYHCGLVLTPEGLWVVDLSGRGVVVNGERMRVSPLRQAAELWVGRFLIGVQYVGATHTPALGRAGVLTPPTPLPAVPPQPGQPAPTPGGTPADPPSEDEVPIGDDTLEDAVTGLPSSHIMADAFRFWANADAASGPVSNPIQVSASGPASSTVPVPRASPPRAVLPPLIDLFGQPTAPGAAGAAGELLRQLGEAHTQLFAQFQNSLVLMVKLFSCLRRDQLPAVQRELSRLQELNAELGELQAEVARRATEVLPSSPQPPAPNGGPVRAAPPSPDSTALHDWVIDRINTLQRERHTRWQSLVGMFGGKG